MWKIIQNMKTPGSTWVLGLMGVSLGTIMGLCIGSLTSPPKDNILEGSIFGKNENLELTVILPEGEELHLKATGAVTMDLVQSLRMLLKNRENLLLEEKYFPSTKHLEELTMKKQDNSSLRMS